MPISLERLIELQSKMTKGPWQLKFMIGEEDTDRGFIQAPRANPAHPYDIEVFGEDGTLYPSRKADFEAAVLLPDLIAELISMKKEIACLRRWNELLKRL